MTGPGVRSIAGPVKGTTMTLDWTAILTGTIPAVINSLAIFLATRYAGHLVSRLEGKVRGKDDKGKDK